jgi:hypothetical protein
MPKALKTLAIQAIPLAILLVHPWRGSPRVVSLAAIGLLVAVAFGIVVRSLRARRPAAAPIGWATLVSAVAAILATEQFVMDLNLDLIYVLFFVSLAGGSVLLVGAVRSLINVDPPVSLERGLARAVGTLAYRLVVPAFLSMPFVWMTLNQFRRVTYDYNSDELSYLVVRTQGYLSWPTLALLPLACGVAVHWAVRWIRSR